MATIYVYAPVYFSESSSVEYECEEASTFLPFRTNEAMVVVGGGSGGRSQSNNTLTPSRDDDGVLPGMMSRNRGSSRSAPTPRPEPPPPVIAGPP